MGLGRDGKIGLPLAKKESGIVKYQCDGLRSPLSLLRFTDSARTPRLGNNLRFVAIIIIALVHPAAVVTTTLANRRGGLIGPFPNALEASSTAFTTVPKQHCTIPGEVVWTQSDPFRSQPAPDVVGDAAGAGSPDPLGDFFIGVVEAVADGPGSGRSPWPLPGPSGPPW